MAATSEKLANRLYIGRTHDGTRVWLDVEIEQQSREAQTVNHAPISQYARLSGSASTRSARARIDDGGGQDIEAARGAMTYEPAGDPRKIARLIQIWNRWHLNDMRAACVHQTLKGADVPEMLDQAEPCEVTGYEYGHAWLVEPLPEHIITELREIVTALSSTAPQSDPFVDRMKRDGITAAVESWHPERHMMDEEIDAWRVRFRLGARSFTTRYYTGYGLRDRMADGPEPREVLDTILSDVFEYDNAGSFEDWASEYGYDLEDDAKRKRAWRTYTAIARQGEQLRTFLGDLFEDYLSGRASE
jgi:hypothetical protein